MTPDKKFLRYSGEAFVLNEHSMGTVHIWFDPRNCQRVLWHEDTDRVTIQLTTRGYHCDFCVPRLEFLRQIYPYRGFSFLESVGPKPEPAPEPAPPLFWRCSVCGYDRLEKPPIHSRCPCCGTAFGYHYTDSDSILRERWIDGGAKWWANNTEGRPSGWSAVDQLLRAFPDEYATPESRGDMRGRICAAIIADLAPKPAKEDPTVSFDELSGIVQESPVCDYNLIRGQSAQDAESDRLLALHTRQRHEARQRIREISANLRYPADLILTLSRDSLTPDQLSEYLGSYFMQAWRCADESHSVDWIALLAEFRALFTALHDFDNADHSFRRILRGLRVASPFDKSKDQ